MKNNWVVMPLLSPQKAAADGKQQTTTQGSSEPFVSRPSRLPGYVNIRSFDDNEMHWSHMWMVHASPVRSVFVELLTDQLIRNS
jgi:hypothetical protein